jgi:DNA invertase Pin-like site-specific DNA recombinase
MHVTIGCGTDNVNEKNNQPCQHWVREPELFRSLGIGFVSCTEAIDTSLPHGEMLFQIIGAIAQWERSLIGERVRAGLQHARNQGKRLGRPPRRVLTPEEITKLRKERSRTNATLRELSRKYGVSVFTAHSLCQSSATEQGQIRKLHIPNVRVHDAKSQC